MDFKLVAPFEPTGDQPEAIRQLKAGIEGNVHSQTLLGVTGSGKTFTVANVIEGVNRPTLVLSHNKTLAAQLYNEFKQFFPENRIEYFVSYYDYYQPESYLPITDTYIEKDLAINDEIEKLRLSATSALLAGRRDVIVVSSVSCIYGIGNPNEFEKNIIHIQVGDEILRNKFLHRLVENLYSRAGEEFNRGNFRVNGDTVDIFLAYADYALRIEFWGDEIEGIFTINPETNDIIEKFNAINIYPANLFVSSPENTRQAIEAIQNDLSIQVESFKRQGKSLEAKRLKDRTEYDIEMIKELGYCQGIENYSRYFDRRLPGTRPFCLLDYFPKDYLMVIDESHVTIPQIRAMWGGDNSRKTNLVEYGFRLEAALDNRPLRFEEFQSLLNQVIYVSATPSDYEIAESDGIVVEQLIRPTGLLDPEIEVRPSLNQIDDLIEEIHLRIEKNERVLVTTLTKRMAEELSKYLDRMGIHCRYIHSEIVTLERVEILQQLREGVIDVLIGVNLLREGIDLPEVSLVIILDADKEGFLRNVKSLVQTIGRAARNVNGRVIMYADTVTKSMEQTIEETNRRRAKQQEYNEKHGITPSPLNKNLINSLHYPDSEDSSIAADPVVQYMTKNQLEKTIKNIEKQMRDAAKELDFMEAARLRDEMFVLQKRLKESN
ncbi:MAG: excinuclease ABC subunit UvrB [Brumimicrobium sp.]